MGELVHGGVVVVVGRALLDRRKEQVLRTQQTRRRPFVRLRNFQTPERTLTEDGRIGRQTETSWPTANVRCTFATVYVWSTVVCSLLRLPLTVLCARFRYLCVSIPRLLVTGQLGKDSILPLLLRSRDDEELG